MGFLFQFLYLITDQKLRLSQIHDKKAALRFRKNRISRPGKTPDLCAMMSTALPTQDALNYQRIAAAIAHIQAHFKDQPSLEELAEQVHLSPFHFQRLFTEWAGTSPKQFLRYTSLAHAKQLLRADQASLLTAAYETGLSGTGRLHDLFVKIEGMTPAEFKLGGKALRIRYRLAESPFGPLIVAATAKGVCHMAFYEDEGAALATLRDHFPAAEIVAEADPAQEAALRIFRQGGGDLGQIKLHLKGTDFQLKVWEALLRIPFGGLSTYGAIAQRIARPGAARAVGTAIGSNPVAFLIPCHRVIQASGVLGGYMWGPVRKAAIIGWEGARAEAM
jgi:AraC family transcriptional regulator of adaptative response/methylated-DNA-[protein]-cysteine methyltransferase